MTSVLGRRSHEVGSHDFSTPPEYRSPNLTKDLDLRERGKAFVELHLCPADAQICDFAGRPLAVSEPGRIQQATVDRNPHMYAGGSARIRPSP